ncbi:hypothetical protein E2P81_ATG12037 [Venturia nashicola]|nr:hypothetical protein E2P81_ATG12037 [Venturia nashicola]
MSMSNIWAIKNESQTGMRPQEMSTDGGKSNAVLGRDMPVSITTPVSLLSKQPPALMPVLARELGDTVEDQLHADMPWEVFEISQ